MLKYCDIIKENNKDLRERSIDCSIPLSNEDIKTLKIMNEYLENGYKEEYQNSKDIRPGVGLAAPQIDVLKKMFVIFVYDEDGVEYHFGVVNPKIISASEELTYLPSGEGCLSVDRNTEGLVHRSKRIKARFHLYNFEDDTLVEVVAKFKNYVAIVFQHEYDHLFGTLFVDHINKENPFFVPKNSSPIRFHDLEESEEK